MIRVAFLFLLIALAISFSPEMAFSTSTQVLIYAHRGAPSIAPENTLISFKTAVEKCGAKWVEFDVHLTKDGIPVIIHDDTLERTTNVKEIYPDRAPWRVCDFSFVEIQGLDAGKWFVEKDPFGTIKSGEVSPKDVQNYSEGKIRIPALRGLLVLLKNLKCKANIEIKNFPIYYTDIEQKIVNDLKALGMENDVVISSFDHDSLARVKAIAPEMKLAALVDQPMVPTASYFKDCLGVSAWNPGKDVLGVDSQGYSKNKTLRMDLIKKASEAGLETNVWTVDDPQLMKALVSAGVSGIFTNFPQRFRGMNK
ncbi:MAG: hypothetical protein HQM08_00515 [Candidatus Riflebacteria bacterium]|nr:hypothetical protein [Candidatus Riflebacteria bacterium]